MQAENIYISSREMRSLEVNAEYFGFNLLQLMEMAGRNVAQEIILRFPKGKKVAIFCGLGGNGGDGFVIARHLFAADFEVSVFLIGKSRDVNHESARINYQILQSLQSKILITEITDSSNIPKIEADIIIDALLGTGTKGKIKAPISQVIDSINSMPGFKVSVDVPTGIDSDTGDVLDKAVKANLTVTFHKAKKGFKNAQKYIGDLIVSDIGLPLELERFAGPGDVVLATKPRRPTSHKGDYGRLLVIGGNEVYSGAPTLASLAAMRTGVDLVYLAMPHKIAYEATSISPDLIIIKLQGDHLNPSNIETLKPFIKNVDVVAIGPGLGLDSETQEFVKACVDEVERAGKTLVLDADGLKAFSKIKRSLKVPLVLTPHAGEYTILTDEILPENLEARINVIQKTAKKFNATILSKGQIDIICNQEKVKLSTTGNQGMTVGGTGDVLVGIVSGLITLGADPFEAAVAGAFINGAAGDFVASEIGFHIVASDIIGYIPIVMQNPMNHLKVKNLSAT